MVKSGLQILDICQTRKERRVSLDPIKHLQLKFITEPDFRKQLIDDPKTALESVGIEATEEILSILATLEADLAKLAAELGIEDDGVI